MKPVPIDFGVRREVIQNFFEPPIGKSTFFDLVNRGKIAEVKELRGYYRLNESLRRLGLPQVDELPRAAAGGLDKRVLADIALDLCMPDELPVPSELLTQALSADDVLEVLRLQGGYAQELSALHSHEERMAFAQGVKDAAYTLAAEASH